jgi:S1-C subfamily serine protease
VDAGALITSVSSGSPADEAGLRAGDVITEMDGDNITGAAELSLRIGSHQVGDQAEIAYYRGNVRQTVIVTLEQSPS